MRRLITLLVFLNFSVDEKPLSGEVTEKWDVLIIGGGTSGTAAGIQSARQGVKTLIVEEYDWLGGMLTSAGVSAFDGNYKLKGGFWSEFRDSLNSFYGGEDALKTGWVSNILFEPSVGNKIFKQIAEKEKNLRVWYRSAPVSFERKEGLWNVVIAKDGCLKQIRSKVIIDATELGDVAKELGVKYDVGMDSRYITGEPVAPTEENDIIQDLTYVMILKEYDNDVTIKKPEGYNPSLFYCSTISKKCIAPKEKNRLWSPGKMITYGKLPNNKYMINWPVEGNDYYLNLLEMSSKQREESLKKAKNHSLSFLYYIQTELGFNKLGLADDEFPTEDKLPFIPYHRESRRINGLVRFTLNHICDPYNQPQKLYRTSIGVGDYPVDQHHTKYPDWGNLPNLYFHPVPSYGLPLGVMIPKEVKGLIIAEKSISVTNLVNGTTRLQPVVLQIGQAAGSLAALAVKESKEISDISVREVQNSILNAGGYLLPFLDTPVSHRHFKAVQRIGVTGIIKGVGMNKGWENQTWFRVDSLISEKELTEGFKDIYPTIVEVKDSENSVTVVSLSNIISGITSQGTPMEVENKINEEWEKMELKNFNRNRALTRLECAVIIDRFADPFNNVAVDIYGNFIKDLSGRKCTTSFPASDPNIRYVGRVVKSDSGSVSFDWSGTYLMTKFEGKYCAARVSDTKKNYYNVFIDNKFTGVITTSGTDSLVILADGIERGVHSLMLQKRSEGEQGKTTIHKFELSSKGRFIGPGEKRERHIEFIGNSITCGYGTEGLSKNDPFKAETENCNLAYGCIISRYFDADYTFIAHSGRGAVRNYGDTARVSKQTMKDLMLNTFDGDKDIKWSFKEYIPDLVVINLGSNDFSIKPHPLREEFIKAYNQIITQIREKYGNIPVLCVAPPKGPAFSYTQEYCNNSKDPNLHFAAYLNGIYNNDSDLGSSGHPNYEGQKKIAMTLIPHISSIMHWKLEDKPIK